MSADQFALIIPFLKVDCPQYILVRVIGTVNGHYPFILHIVETVINGYYNSLECFYRLIGSQYIYVLLLTVGGKYSFNITVIDRVDKS